MTMTNSNSGGFLLRGIYFIRLRVRLRPWLRKLGWHVAGAKFGAGTDVPRMTMTWPHQVQIGSGCVLEDDLYFKYDGIWAPGPSIVIGNDTFLGRGCEFNIRRGLTIGNHCLIASGCKFVDANHGTARADLLINQQPSVEAPITVEDNVWLGANVIVLKGVTLGTGSIVAAGAVVTKSVAAYTIVAGIPARKIGERQPEPSASAYASLGSL